MTDGPDAAPRVERGVAHVLCAFEVGQLIDLDAAARRIRSLTERATIRHKRRALKYFQYRPAPLRVMQAGQPVAVGAYQTAAHVDAVLFDFGAISITYTIAFEGGLGDLVALSAELYEDTALLADAHRRVEDLLAVVGPAVTRPHVADITEEYVVFQIQQFAGAASPEEILHADAALLAQILRAEREPLSAQQIGDATAGRIAFGPADLTLIDGEAAVIFDPDAEDIRAVLEFVNVELLEMRYLDRRLDDALDRAYRTVSRQGVRHVLRPGATRADLQRIAQMQVDGALLFEAVNTALKLIGDQFVARVYRLASDRFHLADWNAGLLRKLETLEGIYVKFSDLAGNRRMEVLEWIIILLIAFEIALSLIRG
jgi:hypothetical protein